MRHGRVKLVRFTTYIFDLACEGEAEMHPLFLKSISDRRERIIGAVRHRRNSGLLANRRAYRLIVTFKVWGEEFPSMILNFLSDSTRVLCYTIIMLST